MFQAMMEKKLGHVKRFALYEKNRSPTTEGTILRSTLLSAPKFQAMLEAGLVQLQAPRVCLTPSGFLLADAIGVEVLTSLERRHELCR